MDQIELELEREQADMVDASETAEPEEVEKKPVRKRGGRAKVAVDEVADMEAKVTYFNKYTMIVGVRCDKVGYQISASKLYRVGETVKLHMKDGVVTIE